MIQVRFVIDYRGVLTGEQFYNVGDVVSFEDATAHQLVKDGRAEMAHNEPGAIEHEPHEQSLTALRKLAKDAGIKGYSRMKKDALLEALKHG